MKLKIATTLFVVVAETRICDNFQIYPEVFDDFFDAAKYADNYLEVLRTKLIEKGYDPTQCTIRDEGLVKYLDLYDGDEYARLEIFKKDAEVKADIPDASINIDGSSNYRENFLG